MSKLYDNLEVTGKIIIPSINSYNGTNSSVLLINETTNEVETLSLLSGNGLSLSNGIFSLGGILNSPVEITGSHSISLGTSSSPINIFQSETQNGLILGSNPIDTNTTSSSISSSSGLVTLSSYDSNNFTGNFTSLEIGDALSNGKIKISDTIANFGVYYDSDYSVNGVLDDRWIPDWGTVKSYTDNSITSNNVEVNNGLTNNNGTIGLGGTLTQDTTIEGNDNSFSLGTPSNRLDNLSFYSDNRIMFESIRNDRSSEIELRGNRLTLFSTNITASTDANIFIDGDFLDIVFSNGNSEKGLLINESDFSFVDDINNFGAKYDSDYSTNGILDDRWIPDYGAVKNYVTSQLGSSTLTVAPVSVDLLDITNNQISLKSLAISSVITDDTPETDFSTWYANNFNTINTNNTIEEGDTLILTSISGQTEVHIHNGGNSNSVTDFTKINNDILSDSYIRTLISGSQGLTYDQSSGVVKLGGSVTENIDIIIDKTSDFVIKSLPITFVGDSESAFVVNDTSISQRILTDTTFDGSFNETASLNITSTQSNIAFTNDGNVNLLGVDSTGIMIRSDNGLGAYYNSDYSSNYTNRSLVDKEYVDSLVNNNTFSLTDGSGTTANSSKVDLGGGLDSGTLISANNNFFAVLQASNINLTTTQPTGQGRSFEARQDELFMRFAKPDFTNVEIGITDNEIFFTGSEGLIGSSYSLDSDFENQDFNNPNHGKLIPPIAKIKEYVDNNSGGSAFALTDGSGTIANGTTVDLGGVTTNNTNIDSGNFNFNITNINSMFLSCDNNGSNITMDSNLVLDTNGAQIRIDGNSGNIELETLGQTIIMSNNELSVGNNDNMLVITNDYSRLTTNSSTQSFTIHENNTGNFGFELTDSINQSGAWYSGDYSVSGISNFGDRWIPDYGAVKAYVNNNTTTSQPTSQPLNFNNGLTETSGTVGLGGTIDRDVVIIPSVDGSHDINFGTTQNRLNMFDVKTSISGINLSSSNADGYSELYSDASRIHIRSINLNEDIDSIIDVVSENITIRSTDASGDSISITIEPETQAGIRIEDTLYGKGVFATPLSTNSLDWENDDLFYPTIGIIKDNIAVNTPNLSNKDITPTNTNGNNSYTGIIITNTPTNNGYVEVLVNGIQQVIGDNVVTKDCHFRSPDGGSGTGTLRAIIDIQSGDELYWNGIVSGFDLDSLDRIDLNYST